MNRALLFALLLQGCALAEAPLPLPGNRRVLANADEIQPTDR